MKIGVSEFLNTFSMQYCAFKRLIFLDEKRNLVWLVKYQPWEIALWNWTRSMRAFAQFEKKWDGLAVLFVEQGNVEGFGVRPRSTPKLYWMSFEHICSPIKGMVYHQTGTEFCTVSPIAFPSITSVMDHSWFHVASLTWTMSLCLMLFFLLFGAHRYLPKAIIGCHKKSHVGIKDTI